MGKVWAIEVCTVTTREVCSKGITPKGQIIEDKSIVNGIWQYSDIEDGECTSALRCIECLLTEVISKWRYANS